MRALQFGTGRFLLGFIGPFIDRANRECGYDGHALIVQSTGTDRAAAITAQDGLYTLVERGGTTETPIDHRRIVDAYAGAVSVIDAWSDVVAVARSPDLAVIVSNVTEAGLAIDVGDMPDAPVSYPARLVVLLAARWRAGLPGVVVLPCELVVDNGVLLRGLVLALAERWRLGTAFANWIDTHCIFADTLVDRIVTGLPSDEDRHAIERDLAYRDPLMTVAEPYALFAIRGDAALADRIGFVSDHPSIRIAQDISEYRNLKLRLLNGGHSALAALAILAGHRLVREAMAEPNFAAFAERLLREEIAPTLAVPRDAAQSYVDDILLRWTNPAIDHHWRDIASGYATKLATRLAAPIAAAAARRDRLAIGMAAVGVLMRDPGYRKRGAWPAESDPVAALGDADFGAQVHAATATIDTDGVGALLAR